MISYLPGRLYGLRLVADAGMSEYRQMRFPRSKGRRIRKKWRRDSRNFRFVPLNKIYRVGDTLVAHPAVIEQLKVAVTRIDAQCGETET